MIPQSAVPSRTKVQCLIGGAGLFVFCCLGCGFKAPSPEAHSGNQQSSATQTSSPLPPLAESASVSLQALDLVDLRRHIDAPTKVWKTETVSAAALKQLKKLGSFLSAGKFKGLDRYLTAQFSCSRLRPKPLSVAFEDSTLTVSRSQKRAEPKPPPEHQGTEGFQRAVQDLFAAHANASDVRLSFKIHRVTLSEEGASTRTRFQAISRNDTTAVEQTATWNCRWQLPENQPPLLASIEVVDFEEVVAGSDGHPLFQDCTASVLGENPSYRDQLSYGADHWSARIEQHILFGPSGWQGLALGDVNGDGLDDLYVCQPGGLTNRLYLQQPDGTLLDYSQQSGTDWWEHTHGALLIDLDNDGDQDLVVGMLYGLVMMANDGAGTFQVAAKTFFPDAMPYSLSAADFDSDGDLDLYACCYSLRGAATEHRFLARPIPYHDANNAGRNALLRNDRRWRFKDVTRSVGLDQNNTRFSLAAAWEDYDNDGDQDLYVANDFGRNNLYRNDGGTFVDVAPEAGVQDLSAGMSVTWADANQDGHMDLYVSNMWSSAGGRIAYQRQFQAGADQSTLAGYQRHARGNSLFLNQGDGTFRDVSEPSHVTLGRWAWGSVFVDINNDGLEDLVVGNGYMTRPDDTGDL